MDKVWDTLVDGWRKHHKTLSRKEMKALAFGQNPKVVSLSCSDSRVNVGVLFGLTGQGRIFQIKNVGGLFTRDAKAALVYALNHLKPDIVLFLHHTKCGGYHSLFEERHVEPEIRTHMRSAMKAKKRVKDYMRRKRLQLDQKRMEALVIEEGARLQSKKFLDFLKKKHPEAYLKIKSGQVDFKTLVYDLDSDLIYPVPEKLGE